jgi:hypothetical protein
MVLFGAAVADWIIGHPAQNRLMCRNRAERSLTIGIKK